MPPPTRVPRPLDAPALEFLFGVPRQERLGDGAYHRVAAEGALRRDGVLQLRAQARRRPARRRGLQPPQLRRELPHPLAPRLRRYCHPVSRDLLDEARGVEGVAAREGIEGREVVPVPGAAPPHGGGVLLRLGAQQLDAAPGARLVAADDALPLAHGRYVSPYRLRRRRRLLHLRPELLDLAVVLLQAGAHGLLEVVDENELGEEWQHVLDAQQPVRLPEERHCGA
eukprot:CAMPEP_0183809132 /NCGR_PEP_ID=MMETSP0803_2-20130417/44936_1 /TAXON_ID=195967 /ORGANISM="Crustomastix stigmata, Strain CCMP3273" /LENGTH=225 /DNA_ID=CAMNT_0026053947 /DNA_START=186 /DNA_END=861 /DNA_ORIENTATION=-